MLGIKMAKALIIYWSQSHCTEKMARAIREGAASAGADTTLKSIDYAKIEDLMDADIIIAGSPTHMRGVPKKMGEFLSQLEEVNLKGKVGASFGSYGGSGEAPGAIAEKLKSFGMNVVSEPGLKVMGRPDKRSLEKCREFGKTVVGGA
ncbi:MAG: flavodoxin domain-containing protein [Halobacteriota archaeon]|nr:flavodoxin domain-containing protein [Halobacteriota archaeon]